MIKCDNNLASISVRSIPELLTEYETITSSVKKVVMKELGFSSQIASQAMEEVFNIGILDTDKEKIEHMAKRTTENLLILRGRLRDEGNYIPGVD